MKQIIFAFLLIFITFPSVAQEKKEELKEIVIESYAMPSRGGAAKFEIPQGINNIDEMDDIGPNRGNERGGGREIDNYKNSAKMRSESTIKISNYTKFMSYVYVNKKFIGVIPKWGDLNISVWDGEIELYGVAHLTDGSKKEFGPKLQVLEKNYFTWILRDTPKREEDHE